MTDSAGASPSVSAASPPLRIGILGAANIARLFVRGVRASANVSVEALASRDIARAEAFAAETGVPRVHATYEALLADAAIDAVYNPLPNSLHAEWTIRAADAGKHVLCEKPLALTVDEVDRIAAAAKRAGVVGAEAFMYRHHPQTLKIKELIASGAIGDLHFIRGAFTFNL